MNNSCIVYQDRHLLVARKEPGLLSEFDSNKKISLPALLSDQLAASGEMSELFTVHRLDRGVGGLILFARHKEAASRLIAMIADRRIEKQYLAVIHGSPIESEGEFFDLLFRDSTKNKSFVVDRMRKGVRDARLSYQVLNRLDEETGTLSLVRILLHTGRTHQIRVQFSSRQMPLWGDYKYGGKDEGEIALFSHQLSFPHPMTGKQMTFTALPNSVFPWSEFPAYTEKKSETP